MINLIIKEFGSDFHLCTNDKWLLNDSGKSVFTNPDFRFFLSGRASLLSILKHGIETHGWEAVYFPSYYCHEVVDFIKSFNINCKYYIFNPLLDDSKKDIGIKDDSKNVIINVNFFGIKILDLSKYSESIIVEDVTHDFFSYQKSIADYCFGSLRKEFPISVGGFAFSPKSKNLKREAVTFQAKEIALKKQTAMYIKKLYFEGNWTDKDPIRSLFYAAENDFGNQQSFSNIPNFTFHQLLELNCSKISLQKRTNVQLALSLLQDLGNIQTYNSNSPFGILLLCKSHNDRDRLKSHLIQNRIYPAILWPDHFEERDKEIQSCILFVHADYRYSNDDIGFITKTIKEFS